MHRQNVRHSWSDFSSEGKLDTHKDLQIVRRSFDAILIEGEGRNPNFVSWGCDTKSGNAPVGQQAEKRKRGSR